MKTAVQEIVEGHRVLAFDVLARVDGLSGRVSRLFRGVTTEWIELRADLDTDPILTTTPGHHFLDEFGNFPTIAEMLERGGGKARIVLEDGSLAEVSGWRIVYSEETAHLFEQAEEVRYRSEGGLALKPEIVKGWRTYNFEVEDYHTYIAGGVRVHNVSEPYAHNFTGVDDYGFVAVAYAGVGAILELSAAGWASTNYFRPRTGGLDWRSWIWWPICLGPVWQEIPADRPTQCRPGHVSTRRRPIVGGKQARGGAEGKMELATKRVGRTALDITSLGLGCASLGGNMSAVSDSEARMIVIDGYDTGVRYFDTAPFYGYGRSEHAVGDVLRARDGWVLSTKVGRLLKPRRDPHDPGGQWKDPHPFDPVFDYSYDAIMRSYEDSIQRLGMSRIDILYIHDVDVFSHGDEERQARHFRRAMDEAYKALDELRRAGDIKAIGLGVNEARPIAEAMEHGQWDCFLLAGRYTLLEQEPLLGLFPAVEKHGASIVVGGPFNSGILVGGDTWNYQRAPETVVERVKKIARVCAAHNVPLAAAAIQFPAAHPLVAGVIPGPRSTTELNQIFDWWRRDIPTGLWGDLKAEKLIDEAAPTPA